MKLEESHSFPYDKAVSSYFFTAFLARRNFVSQLGDGWMLIAVVEPVVRGFLRMGGTQQRLTTDVYAELRALDLQLPKHTSSSQSTRCIPTKPTRIPPYGATTGCLWSWANPREPYTDATNEIHAVNGIYNVDTVSVDNVYFLITSIAKLNSTGLLLGRAPLP
ncbi:uncharacterized protein BP5553_05539 [Venustampulla echinocandica]|uniref:Uncharacterized protein n=1 Tax=Venustampulla echinocandica TaxID=2656787 RepID=A0A370TRE5_9HELO|nr:uncharacterized protein BP5553_05539 [Venustampulla echinocandica]RDL38106.1 hypothetical protein BP5553_05539 [Venustampulla echinocandica]